MYIRLSPDPQHVNNHFLQGNRILSLSFEFI